ncbi:MAG: sigma-54 dependent transcriptional regulator [Candidatus Cloacimonadota bacterium]|nr:sigma-54 dependent transcriptional regulator [Candidatus Cloacimonadota bacterium]
MNILIIDDEKNIRRVLAEILEDEGYSVFTSDSGEDGLKLLSEEIIDLVFLDVKLPGIDGIEVLKKIRAEFPDLDVIMISGHSSIKIAVNAVQIGAYDFLEKPLSLHKVTITARNISEKIRLYKYYEQESEEVSNKYRMIGTSVEFRKVRDLVSRISKTNSKVLIRGENGTGKELVAYALHHQSDRKGAPFIKFNSAAIPKELVESELFGHERGAFTGADRKRVGKLEAAHGGTLFMDEIGDMNQEAQAKILRVIQDGKFERVGSNRTIDIDVRIIAATNKNLEEMVREGQFREDLFYRLNVIPITIPPLRERKNDIPVLLSYYLDYFAVELKVAPKLFSNDAILYLTNCEFPGNVRELKNLVERLYILSDSKIIAQNEVIGQTRFAEPAKTLELPFLDIKNFNDAKIGFEKYYLKKYLDRNGGKIGETAAEVGLQQSNLSRKLKELGIT